MHHFNFSKKREGITIVETMVALTSGVVALLGILTLLTRTLSLNTEIRFKFIAAHLAAEGIEVMKNIIDTNYANGLPWNQGVADGVYQGVSYDTTILSPSLPALPLCFERTQGIYAYTSECGSVVSEVVSPFTRTVEVENVDAGHVVVRATLRWGEGEKDVVVLEDQFFDWRSPAL